MATFQLFPSSGQFWFRLRAANGEIVLSSEGYTAKASCQTGIASVKANCQPARFESFFSAGQYGFNHIAANGEIIGRSEKYTTAQARDHGLSVILTEAPKAPIEDLSPAAR